jgi:hypothetical protein
MPQIQTRNSALLTEESEEEGMDIYLKEQSSVGYPDNLLKFQYSDNTLPLFGSRGRGQIVHLWRSQNSCTHGLTKHIICPVDKCRHNLLSGVPRRRLHVDRSQVHGDGHCLDEERREGWSVESGMRKREER